ncbi:MAG: VOC family protein [Oscillospiraceae bacterium]|nr:VOC family protein [Oscillospiraceae bacterium]
MISQYLVGLQHIGIPTHDVGATVAFYKSLGFEETWQSERDHVAFLKLGSLVVETYLGETHPVAGAIDHLTIDVTDIHRVFDEVKAAGYKLIDPAIITLPFFSKGCSYFMIEGPNKERVEFNQIL